MAEGNASWLLQREGGMREASQPQEQSKAAEIANPELHVLIDAASWRLNTGIAAPVLALVSFSSRPKTVGSEFLRILGEFDDPENSVLL